MDIALPSWINQIIEFKKQYISAEEQMRLAIHLSELNITNHTGGPFGAAIFDTNGRLISVGVNRVVPENCSVAHAEIMAIMSAQSKLEQYRLDLKSDAHYILASSAQPCAMCFGAILWAGVRKLRYGASRDDVQTLTGFDEGPVPENWKEELIGRGCEVEGPALRDEAAKVLSEYKTMNGILY